MNNLEILEKTEKGYYFCELNGRIDATNADAAYEKLLSLYEARREHYVILSFLKLKYISSAGLRSLMHLQNKLSKKLVLVGVNEDVYEILAVTGFVEIFMVIRKTRQVDLSGCKLIGKGASGDVYQLDDENVIKLYPKDYSLIELVYEREVARKATIKGVPTAIAYNIVSANGTYGLQYELMKAVSMQKLLVSEPERLEECMHKYVSIFKALHRVQADMEEFPSAKKMMLDELEQCERFYPPEMMDELYRIFNMIPDSNTLVHRDFHPGNIMVEKNGEAYLVDMAETGIGHPVIDLMSMGIHYPILIHIPGFRTMAPLFHDGLSIEMHEKFWQSFLKMYFEDRSDHELKLLDEQILALSACIMTLNPVRMAGLDEEQLKARLEEIFFVWEQCHDTLKGIEDLSHFV